MQAALFQILSAEVSLSRNSSTRLCSASNTIFNAASILPDELCISSQRNFEYAAMNRHSVSSTLVRSVKKPYVVRASTVHGYGVFARVFIPAGKRLIEYRGERISWENALERAAAAGYPIGHTYFFSLADGRVIDGARKGNEARYINHSCDPNCEPFEHEDGRVYIYAMRDIEPGEELSYYYALIYEGRHTAAVKRAFPCHCGADNCSGSMLAPKGQKKK